MSEQSGYHPNRASSIDNLPYDFLGLDASRVEASAAQQRKKTDLSQGLQRLNDNLIVAHIVAEGCRSYEHPDAVRHIRRGAALAQLLIEDSAYNFGLNSGTYALDHKDLDPQPKPRRDAAQAAGAELIEARRNAVLSTTWRLTPEETAQNENVLSGQVDEVLVRAGLGGAFETAVQGLTGPGLEEPTRELDAKYGAALLALGIGITDSQQ